MAKKDGNDLMFIPVTHKERETGQVSIIKWKLLKVCVRSARELLSFAFTIKKHKGSLRDKHLDHFPPFSHTESGRAQMMCNGIW
jgi:hypothetical protein